MMIWQDGIGEQNWNANSIASLTHEEITAWVASLPEGPEPPERVREWGFWANDHQKAPAGDWHSWLFLGGRGAGKTRAGAEWLAALAGRGVRCALIGPSLHDVREVMIEGPSGLKSIARKGNRPSYEVSRRRLRWPDGGVAYAFSAEDPESLRGPQFHYAWADEFCAWRHPAETLAMLRMGLRLGETPRLCLTTTPKPIRALRHLMGEPGVEITRASTAQNAGHLAPAFLNGLRGLYGGTRLAAQELEGLVVDDGNRALWRADDLARCYGGDSWEAEPPLCEDYELYRVRVFDGEAMVREVEVSAPEWAYAGRAVDFPAGFGSDARVEIAQKSQVYGYGPVLSLALE